MTDTTSTLIQDASHAGLLRALGFQRDEVERNAARQTAALDDELAFVEPNLEYQGSLQRRGIRQGRRNQGLESSSYTRQLLAEQRRNQNDSLSRTNLAASQQRADIESQRASGISQIEIQLAESGLSTADLLAREDAADSL